MRRYIPVVLIAALPVLAGCSVLEGLRPAPAADPAAAAAPTAAPAPVSRPAIGRGKAAASLDRTTESERATALATRAQGADLGRVTVSLGSPSEGGLWLRAPVVKTAGRGHVRTAAGKTLAVDLEPGEGAAILSFGAFRALDLPLASLPEVTVLAQ